MSEDESKFRETERSRVEDVSEGETLPSTDMENPDTRVAINPVRFPYIYDGLIVSQDESFEYRIDVDGNHQVWLQVMINDIEDWFSHGKWTAGNAWHSSRFSYKNNSGPLKLNHYWQYGSQNSGWHTIDLYMSTLPKIDNAATFTNVITGTGGDATTLRICSVDGRPISGDFQSSNGRWSTTLNGNSGTYEIYVEQSVPNFDSRKSAVKNITYLKSPSFLTPLENADVVASKNIVITGSQGAAGQVIQIVNEGGSKELGRGIVDVGGMWTIPIDLSDRTGKVTIAARHLLSGNEAWSHRSFIVVPPVPSVPDIYMPGTGAITDMRGPISGTGAVANAIVEVLKDLDHSFKIGEGIAGPQGQWTITRFDRDMPPGPFSIVARQIVGGVPSDESAARSFKVRPPALTAVTISYPTETSLKFSGTGHTGATVEITVVSGPGGTPPSAVTVTGGRWETTATNWPFGTYSLRAIQKVSDNANGWIESQPYAFTVNRVLPDPSDIKCTTEYRPTFSGNGTNNATVKIADPGGRTFPAPNALVSAGKWSSQASQVWGPTFKRDVHVRQFLDSQQSPTWVPLIVTIPPLAPIIGLVVEDGFSPKFSGTCWSNAVVELTFSDAPTIKHPAIVTGPNWTFQRGTGFEPDVVTHTVTVTQTAASQTSPAASETFKVYTPIPQPVFTKPEPDSEVGRDMTVEGRDGMAGATMQLRDAQSGRDLGDPKLLTADGEWSIELTGLSFRKYTIDALQTRYERPSPRSDMVDFEVVLLPPVFTQPTENGDLPRTATLEGWATSGARVEVWLDGAAEPLLKDIPVGTDGRWKAEVTLPVGAKIIRARQTFEERTSRDSRPLNYNVVPAAPYIETPALDEQLGRRVVVSGFGVPGDTVTVKLRDAALTVLGQSPVLEDRTWSVTLMLDQPGGRYGLVAVASCDGFESAESPERPVVLGTFVPSINVPAAGCWVSDPVHFEGQGKPGVGRVMSWFNPEQVWAPNIAVSTSGWQGSAEQPLPDGGNWCRFRQTLTDDGDGATVSDWVDSQRFEILPASPKA
ncbi:hypothetical protein [Pseudomonas sp. GL-B-19]|uniref:hypothetical protein n=1 Tax=Pseudomonas sp. GL-B-19 TaxID=2832393 RepID=UPI001CC08030|nr:hypothetical protein [Pseudomonas sp. GL-B-19]